MPPGNRKVLGDATNRANLSPVRATGKKAVGGPAMPSFAEFIASTKVISAMPGSLHKPAALNVAPKSRKTTTTASTSAPASTSTSKGKKRKAETSLEEDIAAYKQDLDHIVHRVQFEDEALPSCNVVRGRINKLLDAGIMNKTEFVKAIGVTSNSLNNFLRATGPMGGSGSNSYYKAWTWFRQREVAKLKMPDVKKRQKFEADATAAAASPGTTTAAAGGKSGAATKTKTATSLPDISSIHLPGEETDSVEVYDTCDEIRRKINAHLKTPGLTQAQFCRDLYAQWNAPRCKSIQSKQLADFRAMKGPRAGAKSSVFYAAYVYFEKLRIAQKKPKTAHRENMEERWMDEGGFDLEQDHRTTYLATGPLYMD
ncbi:hypothetical protein F5Y19DRAFT_443926 [Xylariaceae sp. FL1651]|nr:hypothetical protein F5Y19DRAFT_443926 [Xylariaceae sp. FL1651]